MTKAKFGRSATLRLARRRILVCGSRAIENISAAAAAARHLPECTGDQSLEEKHRYLSCGN